MKFIPPKNYIIPLLIFIAVFFAAAFLSFNRFFQTVEFDAVVRSDAGAPSDAVVPSGVVVLSDVGVRSGAGVQRGAVQPAESKTSLPKEVPGDPPVSLLWTDNNEGENLIIQSDRRYYDGSTFSTVYFAITNLSGKEQEIKVKLQIQLKF